MSEKFSAMRNSPDLERSGDSLGENQDSPSLEQLNYRAKQNISQVNNHLKFENSEHIKADSDLENELSKMEISNEMELGNFLNINFPNNHNAKVVAEKYFRERKSLGIDVSSKKLKEIILEESEKQENLSIEQKIKNYTESLKGKKSQQEILRLLIAKFENEQGVEILVNNFKNFLKLHQLAESKPPKEKLAIQSIIAKADLSSSTAFDTSLAEIARSTEISEETKLEISREFGGEHIDSVNGMDFQLKQVKKHTKAIEREIENKSREKISLDSEINELKDELDSLPLDDPKRQELEAKIEQKKELLEQTENEIDRLELGKPQETSFVLREGFSAKLNPDGSRSIKIDNEDFAIKLPSNNLPLFSGTKNLRSINLAFPYLALRNQNIADSLFRPSLVNDSVPSKSYRKMGHLILKSLGFDDSQILSAESIKQLNKDLSKLTLGVGSGQENLIKLGIYDVASQSIDTKKLAKVLTVIRENRGLRDEAIFKKLRIS